MKFALPAVLAATCAAPAVAEVFLKEQFNDEVSVPMKHVHEWDWSFSRINAKFAFKNVPCSTAEKSQKFCHTSFPFVSDSNNPYNIVSTGMDNQMD